MPKDVIVVVNLDAKPNPSEALDILILSTAGAKDPAIYRSLEEVAEDYPNSGTTAKIYRKVSALFEQGKTTLADTLIRKVKIAGIAPPTGQDDGEKAEALIAAIETLRQTDDDWYMLLTDQDGDDYVKALCAWAEGTEPTEAELGAGEEDHRKFYFGQTDNLSLAVKNRRCALIYTDTENLDEEADAAYLGNVGPFYPQSVTWKFKVPQGITMPAITSAQREALEEANVNFLTEEYKKQYVKNGVCCDGEFIDNQLGADYIASYMREELYAVLLENAKVPYTDAGFALVAGAVFATLNRATDLGIIARDPESDAGVFSVVVPKRADATDEEARARQMPDITWEALLEGAVHRVKVVGTLRATLTALVKGGTHHAGSQHLRPQEGHCVHRRPGNHRLCRRRRRNPHPQ